MNLPQPVSSPTEQIKTPDLCAIDSSQNSDPMVPPDSGATDLLQKDLLLNEPMVLPETDFWMTDPSPKDQPPSDSTDLPGKKLWTIDVSQEDLTTSDSTDLQETNSCGMDLSQTDNTTLSEMTDADEDVFEDSDDVMYDSSDSSGSVEVDLFEGTQFLPVDSTWQETTTKRLCEEYRDMFHNDSLTLEYSTTQEESTNNIRDEVKIEEEHNLSTNNICDEVKIEEEHNLSTNNICDEIEEESNLSTNKICDDVKIEEESNLSTNKICDDVKIEEEPNLSTNNICDVIKIVEKHNWSEVMGKPLTEEVACKGFVGEDTESLFKTLSWWVTGSEIYDKKLREIFKKFIEVDADVGRYFKTEKKRKSFLDDREKADQYDYAMNIVKKELQCAAFFLRTTIMVFNLVDQFGSIWKAYYKNVNKKIIGDKEHCIYLRLDNETHFEIVVDVKEEMEFNFEMEMHERSNFGQRPFGEKVWGERYSENMPGLNGKRKERWEASSYEYDNMMKNKLIPKSINPSPEDFETNKWFYPVNSDWQIRMTNKLKIPLTKVRDEVGKKNLNPYIITKSIRGDGNCLFRALSYWVTGSEEHYNIMRKCIVDFMKNDTQMEFALGAEKVDAYLNETMMAENGQWGTDREIIAAAALLETSIYVFTPRHEWTLYKKDFTILDDAGEDEMCLYIRNWYQSHYDVVIDVQDKDVLLGNLK
ncbi:uncharacterized protein LOC126841600 [Adelges cooleyi]|uniref:uncharacterized protein LOC126841600 n=1 Tax=Adelges cooleyi TaxID=133065 RepID=UPI002180600E|nr:uncharacterized protein LOC126841600 [Adelges cooleyi]